MSRNSSDISGNSSDMSKTDTLQTNTACPEGCAEINSGSTPKGSQVYR
jgi:hypothetical protein